LQELGFTVEGDALNQIFARFKDVADAKKNVTDADLEALMADEFNKPQEFYKLGDIQIVCGTMGMPTATVRLFNSDNQEYVQSAVGTGPVDAAFRSIDLVVQCPNTLIEYSVHSVTEGIDALGEVTVRIQSPDGKRTVGGYGADTDIIVSSAKAYMAALNRMIAILGRGDDVQPEGEAATINLTGES
jgi:2-isopropylmalate synthase